MTRNLKIDETSVTQHCFRYLNDIYLMYLSRAVLFMISLYPVYSVVIIEGIFIILAAGKHYDVFMFGRILKGLCDLSSVTLVDN